MDVVWRQETPPPNLAHIRGKLVLGHVVKLGSLFSAPSCVSSVPFSSSLSPTLWEHLRNLHLAPELGSLPWSRLSVRPSPAKAVSLPPL